jgi:hypothetical protein
VPYIKIPGQSLLKFQHGSAMTTNTINEVWAWTLLRIQFLLMCNIFFPPKKQTSSRTPNLSNLSSPGDRCIYRMTIRNQQCCYLEACEKHFPAKVENVIQTQADCSLQFTAAIFISYLQATSIQFQFNLFSSIAVEYYNWTCQIIISIKTYSTSPQWFITII